MPSVTIAGLGSQSDRRLPVTQPMTRLRRRMIDDMKIRNLSAGTQGIYVRSVANFSAFHGRSPDELSYEDVRDYQLHLIARGLKATTICQILSALRFFCGTTLGKPDAAQQIALPRRADPLPAILSQQEVALLLRSVFNLKMRMLFTVIYAATE
jgi:integrase/recombinase XerD